MNDLDTLRPEVREALACMDSCATVKPSSGDGFLDETWLTIRAELLRLTDENARLTGQNRIQYDFLSSRQCQDHAGKWERGKCLQCAIEKAEAELAALRARIAGSRHAFLGPNMDRITFLADEIGPSGKYALMKVEE